MLFAEESYCCYTGALLIKCQSSTNYKVLSEYGSEVQARKNHRHVSGLSNTYCCLPSQIRPHV